MMARDIKSYRVSKAGGDPGGDPAVGIIASEMSMQNIDPVFTDHLCDALRADHIQRVSQTEFVPMNRVAGQSVDQRTVVAHSQVQLMATLDHRPCQIDDVTFAAAQAFCGTNL